MTARAAASGVMVLTAVIEITVEAETLTARIAVEGEPQRGR